MHKKTFTPLAPSDPKLPVLLNLSRQRWERIPKILTPDRQFRDVILTAWRFDSPPNPKSIARKVSALLKVAKSNAAKDVLVAGPLFLSAPLVLELELSHVQAWFPFAVKRPEGGRDLLALIPAQPLTEVEP